MNILLDELSNKNLKKNKKYTVIVEYKFNNEKVTESIINKQKVLNSFNIIKPNKFKN